MRNTYYSRARGIGMDDKDLIHEAFQSHNCSVSDVLPYDEGRYVAILSGVIELDTFLSEQGTLMYCKGEQCVELSAIDGQSVVVEVSEIR